MKVSAIIDSARKKPTHNAAEQVLQQLQLLRNIEIEIIQTKDYRLEVCKGCKQCGYKGIPNRKGRHGTDH